MKIADLFRKLDRLQKTVWFRVAASVFVGLIAIAGFLALALGVVSPGDAPAINSGSAEIDAALRSVLASRNDTGGIAVANALVLGISLVIIWMGLSLTYLGVMLGASLIAAGLYSVGMDFAAQIALGVGGLTMAFTALLRGARFLLSGSNAVVAIAGNVLAEAVRLKLSLVFIILLVFGLSALPWVLDTDQDLRYRVQAFLQYATGGSFWVIALLTLTFGVATVAFEQRDKVIWQTITKPVAPWEYILGKWLGVSVLAAVLLAVSSAGTFLAVESLRNQPATGEVEAFVATEGNISEDRLVLETQILSARKTVPPTLPFGPNDDEFRAGVERFIESERIANPDFARTPATRRKVESDLYKSRVDSYYSVPPGAYREYLFEGLGDLRDSDAPLTLRYRIDAQGNRPDLTYVVTFRFPSGEAVPQRAGLGVSHTVPVLASEIDEDGRLFVQLVNGMYGQIDNQNLVAPNETTISMPRETFHLSYSAGSYRLNYARIALVLWVKLAFLAAVAVWAATFLSFPVACLISIGIFLMAEGTGFISESIDLYGTEGTEPGKVVWYKFIVYWIGFGVSRTFAVYNDLQPTERLVEGRLMSLWDVFKALGLMGGLSVLFGAFATLALKRRELATYSGR